MAKPVEPNFTPAKPFDPFAPEQDVLRSSAIQSEETGLIKSTAQLYQKKAQYVAYRTLEITDADKNIPQDMANIQASKEFDDEYLIPLTSQYTDTFGEAAFNLIGPFEKAVPPAPIMQLPAPKDEFGTVQEPDIYTAFRPQTYLSGYLDETLSEVERDAAKGQEINFDEVAKTLEEKEKLDKATAALQASAIQAAYNEVRRTNKKLTPEDAYSKTIEELQGLETVMSGKGATISGQGMTGPAEPLYRTFVIQKQAGKVPDLSKPQLAYFDYVYKDKQKKIRDEETAKVKKTGIPYVRLTDGSEYPVDVWEAMNVGGKPIDMPSEEERFIKEGGKLDPVELEGRVKRRVIDEAPEIWWADPAKKPAVLNNPESFYKQGILSTDTPFGGTVETPASWLIRSAMTIPNAIAGAIYENAGVPVIEAFGGTGLGEKRAASREEKTPLYKDSPVLLNVAEGRGFTGEQMEAGNLLEMSGAGKIAMTAAGFAADLLDPTLGIMASGAKAGKGTYSAYELSKALYAEASFADALKLGARSGATEFLNDFNAISLGAKAAGYVGEKTGLAPQAVEAVRSLAVGDIRTHMGADLTASLLARDTVKDGLAAGKSAAEIISDLKVSNLVDTTYGKSLVKNLETSGGDITTAFNNSEDLVKAARKVEGTSISSKLLDEHDAAMKSLDNIVAGDISAEATKGIRTKDLARNLGAMAKFDNRIAAAFRAVDASPTAGVPKIYQYVEALGKDGMSALKRQFAYDKALTAVYRNSPKMAGLEDMVAITKNTWANKKDATKILDRVRNSEVGSTAKALIDNKVPIEFGDVTTGLSTRSTITGTTGPTAGRPTLAAPTVEPYYNIGAITDDAVKSDLIDKLSRIVEEQVTYGKIKSNAAGRMRTNLQSGKLTTKDFRTLIDGATDLTAEGMFAGGKGVEGARARDLARTSAAQQLTALEPLEFRSFGRNKAKEWASDNLGNAKAASSRGRVSVQQRRIINDVQQRASAMDIELRRRMGALLGDEAAAKNIIQIDVPSEIPRSIPFKTKTIGIPRGTKFPVGSKVIGATGNVLAGAALGGTAGGLAGAAIGGGLFAGAGAAKTALKGKAIELVRELYGLDKGTNYTRYELLGALIVGPKRTAVPVGAVVSDTSKYAIKQEEIIADTMRWTMRRLFFAQRTTESILDQFTGLRQVFQNDVLSKAGQAELDAIISTRAKAAMANPATYWDEVGGLIGDMRGIISNPDNLVAGVREGDITQVVKAGAKGDAAKIPAEVQIGSFYTAESERIMEDAVAKMIDEDETLGNLKLADGIDKGFADAQKSWFMQTTGAKPENVNEIYVELVKDRALSRATTSRGLTSIDETGFANFIDSFNAQGGMNISSGLGKELDDFSKAIKAGDKAGAAAIFGRNKEAMIYLSELSKSVDDAAETIVRRNGLDTYGIGDAARLTKELEAMFKGGDEAAMMKALLGKDVYEEIKASVLSGKMNDFDKYVDASIRKATTIQGGARALDWIQQFTKKVNSLRYTLLLALRPRFHGPNIITANSITYATTGRLALGANVADNFKALQTVVKGSDWGSAGYYQLAGYFGPQKTPYTYGEIYEAIVSSGIRSETGFVTQVSNQGAIVDFLRRNEMSSLGGTIDDAAETLQNLTTSEDLTFRVGMALNALREGRTLDEAVQLAKRSLFDYSDMTQAEKTLSTYAFIFYAFNRQNFITLLRSLGDFDKLKRYERLLKLDRGLEAFAETATGEEFNKDAFYPDYTIPRPMLGKIKSVDADYYLSGSPIPAKDSMVMAANIIAGKGDEILMKQLHPAWSYSLDLDTVNPTYDKIQPEHAWIASSVYGNSPSEVAAFWEAIVDGEIIPVAAPDTKGGVGGYVYPLNPEQKAKYAAFVKWALNFTGIGVPAQDFARAVSGEGMSTQELGTLGRAAYGVGAITPMKVKRPEAQERSQMYKRIEEIDKEIARMKSSRLSGAREEGLREEREQMLEEERKKLGIKK